MQQTRQLLQMVMEGKGRGAYAYVQLAVLRFPVLPFLVPLHGPCHWVVLLRTLTLLDLYASKVM